MMMMMMMMTMKKMVGGRVLRAAPGYEDNVCQKRFAQDQMYGSPCVFLYAYECVC